jgi:membrane associated rhomboid family serine protease
MREASVGFQCPSCVSEGAKSTRAGRTAYGGLRPGNAGLTSMVLIGINAAVWLAVVVTGAGASRLVDYLALRPNGVCLTQRGGFDVPQAACTGHGDWLPGVSDGAWWQLLTSAFTHVEIWHIGLNMLILWMLGPQLEVAIGRARFLALYLLSALAGSVLVYWAAPEYQYALGASGAIFGLMGGLLVVAFKVGGNVQSILMWIGINFVFTVVGRGFISWQAHLGGFIGGVLIALMLVYAPRNRRTLWQVLGMCLFGIALLGAVVVRTAALT